ncbi:MAG TPA: TlpA disulfide reductase family protein [Streptosporangiaceae bacterium]|nr:TlpA disulfide reductase family protein [Streptosporangiaceae bacterium]
MAAVALALTACSAGPAGQNTPAGNGQNFVAGAAGTTVFGHDSPAAPRVSGTTLSGARLSLSQLHGHVVVLNFWGSWCTPCRAEAPVLAALSQHFGPAGVRFLGVDIRDTPATAEAFQRDFRITYPSLNDPGDLIALDFHSTVPPAGIPTTLVISRGGRIAARVIGGVSYPGLRSLISATLAQRS